MRGLTWPIRVQESNLGNVVMVGSGVDGRGRPSFHRIVDTSIGTDDGFMMAKSLSGGLPDG
jgi:hypothetical protein